MPKRDLSSINLDMVVKWSWTISEKLCFCTFFHSSRRTNGRFLGILFVLKFRFLILSKWRILFYQKERTKLVLITLDGLKRWSVRICGPTNRQVLFKIGHCSKNWIAFEKIDRLQIKARRHRGHHRKILLAWYVMKPKSVPQDNIFVLNGTIPV